MGILKRQQPRPPSAPSGSAPVQSLAGSITDSLAAAADSQLDTTGRDRVIGKRALLWFRVVFIILLLQWGAMLISGAVTNGNAPWIPETQLFTTGPALAALVVLLICWQPVRWVPRLRETVNVGVLQATVLAAAVVAAQIAVAETQAGKHPDLYVGLSFVPALLISITDYVLLYVSYRMHPNTRKTLYQDYKYNKRIAAELRAQQTSGGAAGRNGGS
jgi:hypothetical protein